ncbi:peptide-methionine (S)-S-oxide reductase MsrA [Methanolapillus millepedarum]|uniref:Peptide methionine sulfoxide reductase MsrA n=1 Tax=Methanolapillus millepedarum TaxID=3028296 RepID=A0AA96VEZ5_9EURY|nr:Peptide methionine sulfoxide reductase MsrA 1 [Methanosarcinaceae archaeon Ac7]
MPYFPSPIPNQIFNQISKAYFASGCFWGTEYHFQRKPGVISTTVGYMGGSVPSPSYPLVCTGTTGHVEAVEVVYDENIVSYEELVRLFFETHNFTQENGQGPDIGSQYLSRIYYTDELQKQMAETYVRILTGLGYDVATEILPAGPFWKAEDYHQHYYSKKNNTPYCHAYRKIF